MLKKVIIVFFVFIALLLLCSMLTDIFRAKEHLSLTKITITGLQEQECNLICPLQYTPAPEIGDNIQKFRFDAKEITVGHILLWNTKTDDIFIVGSCTAMFVCFSYSYKITDSAAKTLLLEKLKKETSAVSRIPKLQ